MSPREIPATAEALFRAAFERLKLDKPSVLPKSSPVTQNSVAREAGRDPTALKKSRYPGLIAEIQRWVESHAGQEAPSPTSRVEAARRKNRALNEARDILQIQLDAVASELLAARSTILELHQTIERMKADLGHDNVVPMQHSRR